MKETERLLRVQDAGAAVISDLMSARSLPLPEW